MNELADRPLRVQDEFIGVHWWRLLRWFANLRLVPRWREENTRLILRALRRYYYDGLTRPGKILFIASLLIFLFSYRSNSGLHLLSAALGFSLIAYSALLGWVYRPRVSVRRSAPRSGTAGADVTTKIHLRNDGPRPLYNFIVREQVIPYGDWPKEWQRPHRLRLGVGEECQVAVSFKPGKRGRYQLSGVAVQSYFPFFLTRFTQRLSAPAEIEVLPQSLAAPIPSLRQVADSASKRLRLGADTARKGPSLEYSHSRQYQTGDSLRRLDHRASSRLNKPMSKVFEGADMIRRDQVYLIVDLSLRNFLRWQRRPRDEAALDRRLALAVEIGLSSHNEGFNLAALAMGSRWHTLDGPAEFDTLIATCAAEKTAAQAVARNQRTLPDSVLNEEGLHILVLGRWSQEAAAVVEGWRKAGILTLVFLLPESEADAGSLPAGPVFVEIQPSRQRKGSS